MKLIKGLAIGIVVIITALVLYLTLFFNINQLKPQIISSIEESTGYKANIDGDLGWKLFPSVGIEVNGFAIENPKGFNKKELVRIDHVVADVALLPLLSKDIEVEAMEFKGMTLNLLTDKNGLSNLNKLQQKGQSTKSKPEVAKPEQAKDEKTNIDLGSVKIAGVNIENIIIHQQNLQIQSQQTVKLDYFKLASFSLDTDSPFNLKAEIKQPKLDANLTGRGVINVASSFKSINLKSFETELNANGADLPTGHIKAILKLAATVNLDEQKAKLKVNHVQVNDIKGNGSVYASYGLRVPKVNVSFNLGDVDLTPYLPKDSAEQSSNESVNDDVAAKTSQGAEKEPDLSALASINGSVQVNIKSVKANNIHAENLQLITEITNSVLTVKDISSDLYQGRLQAKARLDARKPIARYGFSGNLSKFQFQPLLKDALDAEEISGETNLSITGNGIGLTPSSIKRKLSAKGRFAVTDGAYHGVDIGKMLSNFENQLKGAAAPAETQVDKTLFAKLGTEFAINNGVMRITNTTLSSPALKVKGNGTASLLTDNLVYKLTVNVTESKRNKSGWNQLRGRDIPFLVTGTLANPKFKLDTEAVLKQELNREKEKFKKKLFEQLGF
ncbi:AsmA family protein [Parashewanella tropica]|uniref:AsmA family protein n=1 Tax=Parashewanella tropica TaxID=2547970 RepID=UPI00105AA7AD|nr:AsmA family protein [Parashewanella tropica]